MKAEKFSDALENIDDRYILEAAGQKAAKKSVLRHWKTWGALAACLCVAAVSLLAFRQLGATQSPPSIVQTAPASDSPSGMRRFMNYNGMRYEFLGDGAIYEIPREELGEVLGTLDYDIVSDPETYSGKDLASSFALGGTVYSLNGYSPEFRLAVEWDGSYYLCESVAYTDGQLLQIDSYFSLAGFPENIQGVSIYDHAGINLLDRLPNEEIENFTELLKGSLPAELENEDYQEIGRAQQEGRSFQISFELMDGTEYRFYLIPSLRISMFGDGRYSLPQEFCDSYTDIFEGLTQPEQPMS